MCFLIAVDWYMMECKRLEAISDSNTLTEIRVAQQKSSRSTLLSLLTIVTTIAVTVTFFLFFRLNDSCLSTQNYFRL